MADDAEGTTSPGKGVPPPAGWYEYDPGRERWWDGTRWTEHWQTPEVSKTPSQTHHDPSQVQRVEVVGLFEEPDHSELKKWAWYSAFLFPPLGIVLGFALLWHGEIAAYGVWFACFIGCLLWIMLIGIFV